MTKIPDTVKIIIVNALTASKRKIKSLRDILINFIYPNNCLFCAQYIGWRQSYPICAQCWQKVIVHNPPFCYKCGRPLEGPKDSPPPLVSVVKGRRPPPARTPKGGVRAGTATDTTGMPVAFSAVNSPSSSSSPNLTAEQPSREKRKISRRLCPGCTFNKYYFQEGWTVTAFDGIIKDCIHYLKYRGKAALAAPLGSLMACFYNNYLKTRQFELIIPVPLSKPRYRQREFNQAELLARQVSQTAGLKTTTGLLVRAKHAPAQVNLDRLQRLVNLKDAFRVTLKEAVTGKNILLIDDVFTTGSTLNECAQTLLAAGAKRISVFALARGKLKEDNRI